MDNTIIVRQVKSRIIQNFKSGNKFPAKEEKFTMLHVDCKFANKRASSNKTTQAQFFIICDTPVSC